MRQKLTAACVLVGLLLLLGAAGDSDRSTGIYIFERAIAGVVLLTAGAILNRRRETVKHMNRGEKTQLILSVFGKLNDDNQGVLLSKAVSLTNEKAANTPTDQSEVLTANQ